MTKAVIQLFIDDSIDRNLLQDFIDMRDEDTKKPMTQRALDMLIRKLLRLEKQGHCPNLLLERSIIGTYQDVYPDETTLKPRESFVQQHTDRSWREGMEDRTWADGLRVVK